MLGPNCQSAAVSALKAFPNGMHIGGKFPLLSSIIDMNTEILPCTLLYTYEFILGGINADNAKMYLEEGASHIIVTSYVFTNGTISFENLDILRNLVGKNHIVLDLSCRKHPDNPNGNYFVVTDKWTKFTTTEIT